MSGKITIDDLYSDSGTFNQEEVLLMLKGKIVFSRENDIVFNTDPTKLKVQDAILLYALAKKILKTNQRIEDEIITYSEVIKKTGINKNTIGVVIKRLKDKNILMKSEAGYEIPAFKIKEVLELIKNN